LAAALTHPARRNKKGQQIDCRPFLLSERLLTFILLAQARSSAWG